MTIILLASQQHRPCMLDYYVSFFSPQADLEGFDEKPNLDGFDEKPHDFSINFDPPDDAY